ncbi:MAG: hypothetical protein K6T71_03165 [Candidatus Bipolaricaulota bacterium]|nr:hypothetical protein [Candidatus Bipolaricaulota bacterium]
MGRRKDLRKKIKGLEEVIRRHQEKIAEEKAKPSPNWRYIAYWEKEILSRERDIERLRKRLGEDD